MSDRIYMSSPDVGDLEEQYVVAAIRSGWIAPLGPDVNAFEAELAERLGVKNAVALSSGTAALHLGLLGLGVGAGDVVLPSTMTFAATANAITYTGAEPYFIDCELETGNMDPALLRQALEQLKRDGEKVAAIVPVDLLGKAVNYTENPRLRRQSPRSRKGQTAAQFPTSGICCIQTFLSKTHSLQRPRRPSLMQSSPVAEVSWGSSRQFRQQWMSDASTSGGSTKPSRYSSPTHP